MKPIPSPLAWVGSSREVVVPVWVTLFFTFIIAGIINDDLDSGDDSDDNIATDLGL